jgi:quercetin dioxygenase-like cupin family protein
MSVPVDDDNVSLVTLVCLASTAAVETIHGPRLDTMSDRLKGDTGMNKVSLTALAREHLETARAAKSGRSAHTVYGGHEHSLRQTLIALTAGSQLDEHESPGEATLQVLHGRVQLTDGGVHWDGSEGDHLVIPQSRHGLRADQDSVVLLTVSKAVGPHT